MPWHGDNTAAQLLPLRPPSAGVGAIGAGQRRAAMAVLAAMGERRAVVPIMDPWLRDDPDRAVAALVRLGPAAEEELVAKRAMRHVVPTVRTAVAQVLQQVGTAKCLPSLDAAPDDSRNVMAAATAQVALDVVKARLAKPASPTVPATRPAKAG